MNQPKAEIVCFVFQEVARRHQRQWLGAARSSPSQIFSREISPLLALFEKWDLPIDQRLVDRMAGVETIQQMLERYLLKGVRLDSHLGLVGLVSGEYRLHLRHDIPTPREMLDGQCQGLRYVTYLNRREDLDKPVGRFAGAFEFLLHDLEHAHKFFGDTGRFRGQRVFFNLLRDVLPLFKEWQDDDSFTKDMDYLISDMNSHTVHLFKYLKAIVLTASLRRGPDDPERLDQLWNKVLDLWQAPPQVRAAALKINHPGRENREDQLVIHDFFLSRFDSVCES